MERALARVMGDAVAARAIVIDDQAFVALGGFGMFRRFLFRRFGRFRRAFLVALGL